MHVVVVLPAPSFLLAPDGQIFVANAAAQEMSGIDRRELEQRNVTDLVADPPEKLLAYLRLCARNRQLLPGSFRWRTKGAGVTDIRCDGVLVRRGGGGGGGEPAVLFVRCRPKAEATDHFVLLNQKIAALSREIVERKKAEQQRDELLVSERAARVEAERNSRLKDEFLATVSHELRTPLNAIVGWTDLLVRQGGLPEDARHGVEVIARNAKAQKQLIEDLLDMSRIISGKVRLDVQHVDVARVIEAAVETVRPAAEAKNIRIQPALDPVAGPVKGDPNRLQQVVWNLLSNAIKFTPKGGRVQVFLERVNSHLEITVADTGEGIRPEFLPHIFDRFRQGDAATTRRHGGLGLGLSIVKQLVELHGGSVRAKSPGEGRGATFSVVLPVLVLKDGGHSAPARPDGPGPAPCLTDGLAPPRLSGLRVLVVDDEPDARDLLKRLLQNCDAAVTEAGSVGEALALLRDEGPVGVIVSDIGMPDVDGYEFIRLVRAMPAPHAAVPAVALTAFARSEDRTRAMLAGYQMHLSKPIDPAELIAAIATLTGRTGRRSLQQE